MSVPRSRLDRPLPTLMFVPPLQVANAMQDVLAEQRTVHPGTTATFCPTTSQYVDADISWRALYNALTVA